jgi:hypothetical protein
VPAVEEATDILDRLLEELAATMRRILPAGLFVLLLAAPAVAQPSTIGPGDIRCPGCAVSGQKPATAAFDASQIEFVANPAPAFVENQTIRFSVIARVLQPAPLILDVLDSRIQTLDRNMRVVATGFASRACGG